jgi:hypothetical protein
VIVERASEVANWVEHEYAHAHAHAHEHEYEKRIRINARRCRPAA